MPLQIYTQAGVDTLVAGLRTTIDNVQSKGYDDTEVKARIAELESRPAGGGADQQEVADLKAAVEAVQAEVSGITPYDDAALSARVTALESTTASGGADPLSVLPLQAGRIAPVVGWFGDSWSAESTMGAASTLPTLASRELAVTPMTSAINGSGFGYSASGHDGFETQARVDAVTAAAPNLIVVVGSLNADKAVDGRDTEGATITAAAKTFIERVRARLPQVPIVVVGPQPSSIARLLSRSAHVNARATKAGVEAAGGLTNGVVFVDWLGVADRQAVLWQAGRTWATGDVIVYAGVAWRVTGAWTPGEGETPETPGAPVVQASAVLSGTGHAGAPRGDGTRDTLLQSDETHPTVAGNAAFAVDLAARVRSAVAGLSTWIASQGVVVPVREAESEPVTPGDGLPVMAYLASGWGDPSRTHYTPADITAIAALHPDRIVPPLRSTLDSDNAAVTIEARLNDKGGTARSVSDSSLNGLRNAGIDIASLTDVLTAAQANNILNVSLNVRNGLTDAAANYWRSSDGKIMNAFTDHPLIDSAVHGRGQNGLREIMVDSYPQLTRIVDATDAASDGHLTGTVRAGQQIIVSAAVAGPTVWRALTALAPEGIWVLAASQDEMASARLAAEGAGVEIVGWAVASSEALAAVRSSSR